MKHTDKFLLAGVIGYPIMHSRSPMMHNHWLEKNSLVGRYVPLAIQPAHLEGALRGLHPLGFSGCNVTIPHKQACMQYLDELSPSAKAMGAVSCIHAREDGSLFGTNNDSFGFIRNLQASNPNWRADAGPITVIGAGGGSRAVCYGLIQEGAKEIRLVNRSFEKAQVLANSIGSQIKPLDWSQLNESLNGIKTLVNATSLGMVGQAPLVIDLSDLDKDALVTDIIYIPLETDLLKTAKARGNPVTNGLGMLLHQGPLAWKIWFGIEPLVTEELRGVLEKSITGQ
ncbi:MAG: shikimate dehydrogenase [Burkholderiaceae bacterium]